MNSKFIDSMKEEVKTEINNYIDKGWSAARSLEISEAMGYADKIITLSNLHKYAKGLMTGYYLWGLVMEKVNQYDKALEYYLLGLKAVITTGDSVSQGMCYNNIGRCYGYMKYYDKAFQYFMKGLEVDPAHHIEINIAKALVKMGKFNEAETSLLQLDKKIQTKEIIKIDSIYLIYTELAELYLLKKDYSKGDKYLQKINLADFRKNDLINYYQFIETYAKIKFAIDEPENVRILVEQELKFLLTKENVTLIPLMKNIYADYHAAVGNYKEAIKIKKEALEKDVIAQKTNSLERVRNIQTNFEKELKSLESQKENLERFQIDIGRKIKKLQGLYSQVSGIGNIGIFSSKLQNIVRLAELFHKDKTVPVLIEGETGTGKEIIARMVHFGKHNSSEPFITINCAAISPSLFESELFGYEAGSFTGASSKGKQGKLELANGGTIFLDEIGEMPLDLQVKLLRVLQEKEFYRVGGYSPIKLDFRVIAATNRDLKQEIINGNFRSDLYYRLNAGYIFIPPLRERREEIIPLTQMFMAKFSKEMKKKFIFIEKEAELLLEQKQWKGNIRELQNFIRRIVLLHDSHSISVDYIVNKPAAKNTYKLNLTEGKSLRELMCMAVENISNSFDGNVSQTAEFFKTSRNRIYNYKD
jgi:transcriptional regulator with PAS, ATPase and Fis domain